MASSRTTRAAARELQSRGRCWTLGCRPAFHHGSSRPAGGHPPLQTCRGGIPHADDETVTCGGTPHRLAASGALVTLVLLTGGERGNPAGAMQPELAHRRRAEAGRAARVLGISNVVHASFADAEVSQHVDELTAYLAAVIEQLRPDLLITYDLAGLDGHSDHVACANAVTAVRRTSFPDVALWYVTLPRRVLRLLRAVGQLVTSDAVEAHRASPTLRLFIGPSVAAKLRALRAYKSQRGAVGKGLGRFLPAALILSVLQHEYFAEV
jgi:LmbE family N-acetylglucosaminyl deacetylase